MSFILFLFVSVDDVNIYLWNSYGTNEILTTVKSTLTDNYEVNAGMHVVTNCSHTTN